MGWNALRKILSLASLFTPRIPGLLFYTAEAGKYEHQRQHQECKPDTCNLLHQGTADTSPPSTCRETPVMYEAAGESKNAAALPSSSGSP